MKLEIGMYARTRLGIGHILNVSQYDISIHLNNNNDMVLPICETNIKKASHDIIDLIEIGDYVNGYKVVSKGTLSSESDEKYLAVLTNDYGNFWSDKVFEQDIKTILTKEQLENNCYKIGGK